MKYHDVHITFRGADGSPQWASEKVRGVDDIRRRISFYEAWTSDVEVYLESRKGLRARRIG